MASPPSFTTQNQGGIYTLAQKRTDDFLFELSSTLISGKGTRSRNNPALHKRVKKKAITNAVILALIDIAKENGESKMVQHYWNTYHCQNELVRHNNKLYGKYCKNRWCTTCCGIRKADLLNKYYPILVKWEEPHLLTVTVKAVKGEKLNSRITEMIKKFDTILDRCNKRFQSNKGMKIMGVKSLECNFNATQKTYNPHYHIITPNRVIALYLKQEWCKEWNKHGAFLAAGDAQDIRKIENMEEGLIEVIKYGAKMLSDPNPQNKVKRRKGDLSGLKIYAAALHTIYKAMKQHRLYGSFGFKLGNGKTRPNQARFVQNYDTWKYDQKTMDWINTITGKRLTEFEIDEKLQLLLTYDINLSHC